MVERFHPTSDSVLLIAKHPNGGYVRYSDYTSLQAEVERLTQERDRWEKAYHEANKDAFRIAGERDHAQAELAKLREGGEPVPVEYMVQRFLQWKLPIDFSPDGGIQFVKQTDYGHVFEPVGTNLLDYTQAKAMVLHMLDGAAIATTEQTDARSGVAIKALRSIAEGNLGDAPWQANYARIRQVAADALEALSPAAPEGRQEAVAEITQECRYCANTGWFYGDPDLGTYCGCAFGKVREEASADRPTERAVTEAMVDRALACFKKHPRTPEQFGRFRETIRSALAAALSTSESPKETDMPKLTSKMALELVTRIEDLNDQISAVYREVGETYGVGEINAIREIVNAREAAADRKFEAEGLLEALDLEDEK